MKTNEYQMVVVKQFQPPATWGANVSYCFFKTGNYIKIQIRAVY